MVKRPSCLQGRQRNGAAEDWSAFPIRQLFVLGKSGTFVGAHRELCGYSEIAYYRDCKPFNNTDRTN